MKARGDVFRLSTILLLLLFLIVVNAGTFTQGPQPMPNGAASEAKLSEAAPKVEPQGASFFLRKVIGWFVSWFK